ncbi:hypothetical protein OHB44_28015 [Micromonospora sp. NBC_00821]|uniref:hypothetical protein n=1 Tax=Micromonospora sp. NBC_00821 TaxID=2975977 RepID=UPI002ED20D88|nr:hypothetical protein OHB44_28015 [Micromonospora sp. NBC_00821]
MAFSIKATGSRELTAVRRNLRMVGDGDLSRQMSRGLQRAAKPLKPAVQKAAVQLMPSGYGPLLSKSVRLRTSVRERRGSASVQIKVTGAGKRENRDVVRINRGVLRHPIPAGRRHPWVDQRVRRGFVDRPVDGLGPDVAREMRAVVDWIADQITKG